LNGFSPDQLRRRAAWNRRYAGFDWRPPARNEALPLDWAAVDDAYGGARAFAPADFVFIGRREAKDRGAVAIGDSNGCAAGPDVETAKLSAVLELIERDATGRWWYGRRRRAPIDPADVEGISVFTRWLSERERQTLLFDITTDLDIPVMAAASSEPDGREVALGFAARLDANAAAISALTEMVQMEASLAASRALGDMAGSWAYWRRRVTMRTPPLDAAKASTQERLRGRLSNEASFGGLSPVLNACARAGVDLWFADMTRAAIVVPVFRALSTTLCHYKPRFARKRLCAAEARVLPPAAGPRLREPWLTT
jgi:ribosomal protein S12 methylthiotransferase accessory factor